MRRVLPRSITPRVAYRAASALPDEAAPDTGTDTAHRALPWPGSTTLSLQSRKPGRIVSIPSMWCTSSLCYFPCEHSQACASRVMDSTPRSGGFNSINPCSQNGYYLASTKKRYQPVTENFVRHGLQSERSGFVYKAAVPKQTNGDANGRTDDGVRGACRRQMRRTTESF